MIVMWWEIPKSLEAKGHVLHIGCLNARQIAEEYGTPLYVTDGRRVEANYNRLFEAFKKHLHRKLDIHYSIKANSNIAILKLLETLGSSVDAISPFEVLVAQKAGFSKNRIICTGTSFSDEDMLAVADKAVMNLDSISQLKRYSNLVRTRGFEPNVSIRINPGKGAGHCPDCVTSGEDAKYGVPEHEAVATYKMALDYRLNPIGIHQHIGSGILPPDLEVFFQNARKLLDIAVKVKDACKVDFTFVDFGGGLGIPYKESDTPINIAAFGKKLSDIIEAKALDCNLGDFDVYLEPGRFIVGDSTILLTKVVDCNKKYVNEIGVNAGFNILDRPARYKTYHEIVNVDKADLKPIKFYRVSGNLCESGDVFTENKHALRKLPATDEGDFLAILNAGAYGSSMSSNYNMRPRAREIIVYDGKVKIIRERDGFDDLIRNQQW